MMKVFLSGKVRIEEKYNSRRDDFRKEEQLWVKARREEARLGLWGKLAEIENTKIVFEKEKIMGTKYAITISRIAPAKERGQLDEREKVIL